MESPKRKAQKSRDYRRHRMMRLLNRRKATAQKAMSEIAQKELMRKLRITPLKKFEDGKNALLSSTPKLSNIPKFNFKAPVIEKDVPEYEEIKPAREIPIEPVKQREAIIPGLQPQQPIPDSRFSRSHPIFKDEYDYMNSDAFLTRVNKMTKSNNAALILATNMRNNTSFCKSRNIVNPTIVYLVHIRS